MSDNRSNQDKLNSMLYIGLGYSLILDGIAIHILDAIKIISSKIQ